jgi:serine/threonine-protein kinase RsbW/stage II sporulation protein AB (anti-sigma F factor)
MTANDPGSVPYEGGRALAADVIAPAVAGSVPRIRATMMRAARSLGADERMTKRIALAVSEAATNAVLHAYPDRRPGVLHASLAVCDSGVELVVADDGIGLTPRRDSPGLGMGLGIIAEVSDGLEIESHPGAGTELRMVFGPR